MTTVFKEMSDAAVQPGFADDRPAEAQGFISPALPGESICEGWVTAYEVTDKVGDVGTFGMFAASLKKFREQGKRIAVTEAHDWTSKGIVGYCLPDEIVEVRRGGPGGKGGLFARMHLLTEDSQPAALLYKLMQELPLQMSYAFDTVSEKRDPKTKANRLLSVQLLEITICLFGAVEQTSVRARKQREAIARMPEYKKWAREKRLRDVDLMTAILDQDRPNQRALKPPVHDSIADFEAFMLGYENDADPVRQWDRLMKKIEAKAACCSSPQTKRMRPVARGAAPYEFCENCAMVTIIARKSWSPVRIEREYERIMSKIKIVSVADHRAADAARAKRMLADLKKAMQRREVADLVRYSKAPARPSKAAVRKDVDELLAFSKASKTSTNPETLFSAPPLDPKEHV
jgi:HK97 family phage prohead protease